MEIREASDQDIPAIVRLLKVSLGESLLPKSEIYWRWKHLKNPFGQSPVLLAIDNYSIVGVRAFMRWRWESGGKKVQAVRAVDTATHPDYQGKGIFSQLTKALLDRCADDGVSLVFNTPNEKSMPGYLKMGWESSGRLPVRVGIRKPLAMATHFFTGHSSATQLEGDDSKVGRWLRHPGLSALLKSNKERHGGNFISDHSPESLRWRYLDVPVERYYCDGLEKADALQALVVCRRKPTRFGTEMRIADYFANDDTDLASIRELVRKMARALKADYVTSEGLSAGGVIVGTPFKSSLGPIVTVRELSGDAYPSFKNFTHWRPSVGDLELF